MNVDSEGVGGGGGGGLLIPSLILSNVLSSPFPHSKFYVQLMIYSLKYAHSI